MCYLFTNSVFFSLFFRHIHFIIKEKYLVKEITIMDILDYLPTAVSGSWNNTVIETQPEAMEYSEMAQKLH